VSVCRGAVLSTCTVPVCDCVTMRLVAGGWWLAAGVVVVSAAARLCCLTTISRVACLRRSPLSPD
jgi:hypothetical protein